MQPEHNHHILSCSQLLESSHKYQRNHFCPPFDFQTCLCYKCNILLWWVLLFFLNVCRTKNLFSNRQSTSFPTGVHTTYKNNVCFYSVLCLLKILKFIWHFVLLLNRWGQHHKHVAFEICVVQNESITLLSHFVTFVHTLCEHSLLFLTSCLSNLLSLYCLIF